MSKFVKVPWDVIDNAAIHSDAELGLIVRLARKAGWKEKNKTTLKDGTEIFLAPGEMIISERDIAEGAGIHRTTVRRLFERLERAGLCARRCANQRSSNGTILSWSFLQEDQDVNDGCITDVKPSLEPSCVQISAVIEPSINIDIDTRYQIADKEESPLTPLAGGVEDRIEPNVPLPSGDLFAESVREDEPKKANGKRDGRTQSKERYSVEIENAWLDFRDVYPKANNPHSWTPAKKLFVAQIKSGLDPEVMVAAAEKYGWAMKVQGNIGTRNVADARTWLYQERWVGWIDYDPKNVTHLPTRGRPSPESPRSMVAT